MTGNMAHQFGQHQKASEQLGYFFGGTGVVNPQYQAAWRVFWRVIADVAKIKVAGYQNPSLSQGVSVYASSVASPKPISRTCQA